MMQCEMTPQTLDVIPEDAPRIACLCDGNEPLKAGDQVRWLESFHDQAFPPVPFPSRWVHAVAGTERLRALVVRHHERLLRTEVAGLFPADPARLRVAVEGAADFVVEACGGPELFTPHHGPMRMRQRHLGIDIDERAREVWLRELLAAFDDVAFPGLVREEYWNWMETFSLRVISRRTSRAAPRRHPFATAAASLTRGLGGEG